MIQKHKVAAYITQADWLLVFSEPAYPAAGTQIPGGTIQPGEDPDSAVLREAEEETGLTGLRIRRYLGTRVYHLPLASGDSVTIHRRFYQLTMTVPLTSMAGGIGRQTRLTAAQNPLSFSCAGSNSPTKCRNSALVLAI
jgi:hypothetical protein